MNKQQRIDSQSCEEMQSNGEDMDCTECSCSVCIAQVPNNKYQLMRLLQKCEEFDKTLNMMEPSFIQSKLVVDMPVIIKQIKDILKED